MKVAPRPGRESSWTRPPCASAIASHDREPEAGCRPKAPRGYRHARSARRSAPGRRGRRRGPRRAPRAARDRRPASCRARSSRRRPVWRTAFSARFMTAWVSRCWSATTIPTPVPSSRQSRSPRLLRLREQVVGEQVEVDRARPQEVGPRRLAPAPAGRRRSGSSGRARPGSRRSPPRARAGESPSVSTWPRITVIGVRSSWLTSERKSFWSANAASSRSSMLLKVRPSSAISSLPRTGIRLDRSVSEIVRAVRDSAFRGAIARPAASQMNSDANSRTTTETPIAIRTALSTWSRSAAVREAATQHAAAIADRDRDRDEAWPGRTACRPRRSWGRSRPRSRRRHPRGPPRRGWRP